MSPQVWKHVYYEIFCRTRINKYFSQFEQMYLASSCFPFLVHTYTTLKVKCMNRSSYSWLWSTAWRHSGEMSDTAIQVAHFIRRVWPRRHFPENKIKYNCCLFFNILFNQDHIGSSMNATSWLLKEAKFDRLPLLETTISSLSSARCAPFWGKISGVTGQF